MTNQLRRMYEKSHEFVNDTRGNRDVHKYLALTKHSTRPPLLLKLGSPKGCAFPPVLETRFNKRYSTGSQLSRIIRIRKVGSGELKACDDLLSLLVVDEDGLQADTIILGKIDPKYVSRVSKHLASSTSLKTIQILGKLSKDKARILCYVLLHSRSLQTLDLAWGKVVDARLAKIIRSCAIHPCLTLETLVLSRSRCGKYTYRALQEVLQTPGCRLRCLEMRSLRGKVVPRDISPIATALQSSNYRGCLEEINLDNTWIHSNTMDVLIPALKQNKTLRKLSLSNCKYDSDASSSSSSSSSSRNYYISEMTNESWVAFGNALPEISGLQIIDISHLRLFADAWASIGNGLKNNKSLRELIARQCATDDDGDDAIDPFLPIFESLQVNTTLMKLDMSGSKCHGIDSIKALVSSLSKNRTLRHLAINDCNLDEDMLRPLIADLHQCCGLQTLEMSPTRTQCFSDKLVDELAIKMRDVFHLTTVDIFCYERYGLTGTEHPIIPDSVSYDLILLYASLNRKGRRCLLNAKQQQYREPQREGTRRQRTSPTASNTIPAALWPLILDNDRLNAAPEPFLRVYEPSKLFTELIYCLLREGMVSSGVFPPPTK